MKICVLIPVYNEAQRIGLLLEEIKIRGIDVIVVDDGSTDSSGMIAKEKGVTVLIHPQRMGKGASLRDGFAYIVQRDYTGVITMDGDRQHAVTDLDAFINKAQENPSSVIVGSRMQNHKSMPWIRLIVNKVMSGMISSVSKQNIPDTQCGFRYIGYDVLKSIRLTSSDFEIESELLIKASRAGFKIYPVAVQTIYRNESSKINPFLDTVRFFVYLIKETCSRKS